MADNADISSINPSIQADPEDIAECTEAKTNKYVVTMPKRPRSDDKATLVDSEQVPAVEPSVIGASTTSSHGGVPMASSYRGSSVDFYPSLEMNNQRPTSNMFAAVLVCITCNLLFGPLAVAFAVTSRRAYKKRDMERGEHYSALSLWMSVLGLLSTLVITLLVVVFVVII